jgi:hypothetical protein
MIGVEWFASREISLHGEYIGSAQYSKTKDTYEQTYAGQMLQQQTREVSGWSFGANGLVRFGLSVYF